MYLLVLIGILTACYWYLSPKRRAARSLGKLRCCFINTDHEAIVSGVGEYLMRGCSVAVGGSSLGYIRSQFPYHTIEDLPASLDGADRVFLYEAGSYENVAKVLSPATSSSLIVLTHPPYLCSTAREAAACYGVSWYCRERSIRVAYIGCTPLYETVEGGSWLALSLHLEGWLRRIYGVQEVRLDLPDESSERAGSMESESTVATELCESCCSLPTREGEEPSPLEPAPEPVAAPGHTGLPEPCRPMMIPRRGALGQRSAGRVRLALPEASPDRMPTVTPSMDVVFIDPVMPHDTEEVTLVVPPKPQPRQGQKRVYVSEHAGGLMKDLCTALSARDEWFDVSMMAEARNEVSAAKARAGQLPTIDLVLEEKGTAELIVSNWNKSDRLIRHTNKSGLAAGKRTAVQKDKPLRVVLVNALSHCRCLTSKSHFHLKFHPDHGLKDVAPTPLTVPMCDVRGGGMWRLRGKVYSGVEIMEMARECDGQRTVVQEFVEGDEVSVTVIITPQYEFLVQRNPTLPAATATKINDAINAVLTAARPQLSMSRSTPSQAMCTFGVLSFDFVLTPATPLLVSVAPQLSSSPHVLQELLYQVILPLFHDTPRSASKLFEKLSTDVRRM
eukprot:TRINITY_DN1962_c2_g1_i2.p1 TRINITY_DN1962_c2_g1~~TRINITY_DN1962_c2_g1_i2.p1  ORF type:complete len:616 (+),score=97.37 TRINITY_DN1962_c2_g1_i2:585-2432(+)